MLLINNPFVTSGYIAPEYFCDREKNSRSLNIRKRIRKHCSILIFSIVLMPALCLSVLSVICSNNKCSYGQKLDNIYL